MESDENGEMNREILFVHRNLRHAVPPKIYAVDMLRSCNQFATCKLHSMGRQPTLLGDSRCGRVGTLQWSLEQHVFRAEDANEPCQTHRNHFEKNLSLISTWRVTLVGMALATDDVE